MNWRFFRRDKEDAEQRQELESYLDIATAENIAQGMSVDEAGRAARRKLGNLTRIREEVYEMNTATFVDSVVRDVRVALRLMKRKPMFAATVIVTLALGIGASTAIFSVVNTVLLQPLPYPYPERLVSIWDGQNGSPLEITFGTYKEIAQRNRTFESLAVARPLQVTLVDSQEPERINGQYVSASYFGVLGVHPALGRDFTDGDDQPNAPISVILSDALWRRHFGGDRTIVGRQVRMQGTPVTVIGIMPSGFENVLSPSAEVWAPLQYDPALPADGREWGHHLRMIGSLRAGATFDSALQEINGIARAPLAEFPRVSFALLSNGFIANALQDEITRPFKPALVATAGAVCLLLVIACVNVTNLLLARGAERRSELAMRETLGASRWRLANQLTVETLLLAVPGGGLGIALAYFLLNPLISLSPAELPRAAVIQMDGAALAFATGLTMVLGLIAGIVPVIVRSRTNHGEDSHRITGRNRFTRHALVAVQMSIACTLLIGAGLLLRSVQELFALPPGFEASNLLTMQVQVSGPRFRDPNATHQFFDRVVEAARQVPGVAAAAYTSQLPLSGSEDVYGVHFESVLEAASAENGDCLRYAVSPGYFEAMGIPLRQGRYLDSRDVAGAPQSVVINESFARRRIPGVNPIGQRLHIGPDSGPWFTVVGVVGDVTQSSLSQRTDAVYVNASQWQLFADNARWLVVRGQRDILALTPQIRAAIHAIDREQPIVRIASMDQRLRDSEAERRFALVLFEAFALVALLLAAIGSYSVLAGSVVERTREIGVRIAVGASQSGIVGLILRQGMTVAWVGIGIGVVGSVLASRALAALLFGVSTLDLKAYAGVVILLVVVSGIACAVPAWRAASVDPARTLRSQ